MKDKVADEGRKIPLTPYLTSLLLNLKRINETPPRVKKLRGGESAKTWQPSEWVFFSKTAADGRLAEPRIAHNRALSVAGLQHVTLHGLRRTFSNLAEWVEMPTGVVAQIMEHAPSATAERHYKSRPLDLLPLWHRKYEAWILEQAGVPFECAQGPHGLRGERLRAKRVTTEGEIGFVPAEQPQQSTIRSDEEARAATEALRAVMERQMGKQGPGTTVPAGAIRPVLLPNDSALQRIAGAFGRSVVRF